MSDLAVDLYGEHAVAHFFATDAALEARALTVLEELGFAGIYCKRHLKQKNELVDARDSELAPVAPVRGRATPDELIILEHGIPYEVRLGDGLRTGLFLDQRDNRKRVRDGARDKRVLNLFAYTGGFSVAALAGGAGEAISVDVSGAALQWADRNVARIGAAARHRSYRDDAFDVLARLARRGERFDWIILDPPSYATAGKRRFVARRDYAKLCQACARVLAPGGVMLASINHHAASQAWLRREARSGIVSAGRTATSVRDLATPLDFPARQGEEPLSKSVIVTCG